MALNIIVTDAGRAALVNAANNGTNPVVIAQTGITATAIVPSASATVIPGEIKRISTISGDVVADDMIHLVVRDETADSYALRSFGLYLADGTLFAIYGQAEPVVEKSAQAMMLLAIDIAFADIDAAAITFGDANFINPPATETVQGVVELATPAETAAGVDTTRAVHPKGLKDSVTSWLNSRFGEGNPSAFMKSLLATASAAAMRVALGIKSAALKDEGAGGFLDADLLDGQHGAYYANVPARLGYTPANKAGETFTGGIAVAGTGRAVLQADGTISSQHANGSSGAIAFGSSGNRHLTGNADGYLLAGAPLWVNGSLAWTVGNDGAGSGMDADLLDGQHGAYYANIPDRLGYTPLNKNGDTAYGYIIFNAGRAGNSWIGAAGGAELEVTASAGGGAFMAFHRPSAHAFYFGMDIDNQLKIGGWSLGGVGHVLWHSGNDGAGSGTDADMLDGLHADAFDRFVAQNLSATDGYVVHSNGLKECWTMLWVPADSAATWALPVAHSSWVNPVIAMSINNGENNAQQTVGIVSATTSHITIYSAVNYGQYVRIQTKGV